MSLLGFDTLFKPIIIAYLLVYVNIVILKPHFHLDLFVLLKISDYSIVKIISRFRVALKSLKFNLFNSVDTLRLLDYQSNC